MARYTLKVFPLGPDRGKYRIIEISGADTLDDLCVFILKAYDFFHEHLYEFLMDNRRDSDDRYMYYPMEDYPSTDIEIGEFELVEGQNFLLHYDFGDSWYFRIQVQKIEEEPERTPPELIKSVGHVRQYPNRG